jgi:hypothetical protein
MQAPKRTSKFALHKSGDEFYATEIAAEIKTHSRIQSHDQDSPEICGQLACSMITAREAELTQVRFRKKRPWI